MNLKSPGDETTLRPRLLYIGFTITDSCLILMWFILILFKQCANFYIFFLVLCGDVTKNLFFVFSKWPVIHVLYISNPANTINKVVVSVLGSCAALTVNNENKVIIYIISNHPNSTRLY